MNLLRSSFNSISIIVAGARWWLATKAHGTSNEHK